MMAKNIRRGTFVLPDTSRDSEAGSMSGIDRQNVMRLRINRIALVQELKVDHILGSMMESGVITELDKKKVDNGTTHSDRARILIDILPSKSSNPDWYNCFRDALLNPDAGPDVKKRYRSLVEFLDNTVIHRPNSQSTKFSENDKMKLPHYQSLPSIPQKDGPKVHKTQNVLNLEEERQKAQPDTEMDKRTKDMIPERDDKFAPWGQDNADSNLTLVKGFFQQWVQTPDNFRSLIQVPEDHFQKLQESLDPDDKEQLIQETKALEKIRKLELVAVLARRKLLPQGFELCMCEVVHDILFDSNSYHFLFKYLKNLQSSDVHLLADIVDSYSSIMQNLDPSKSGENTQLAIKLGFHLIDFLGEFNFFKEAEVIMSVLLIVLNQSHNMETWMAKYNGFIKLMHYRNTNYDFSGAYNALCMANEMVWQVELMSFGQNLLNKGEMYTESCILMLERGSINTAHGLAQKALKEVTADNPVHVINALCVSVVAYCSKWSVKRAESLAVQAVQQAKYYFGTRHPMYIKALLAFCHFSNEFKQDQFGLDIARYTLEVAEKTYGCQMILVAQAHRAVCKAMLVMQKFDDLNYSTHATSALRIARILLHDNHPMLYIFLHTAASALQWQALHSSKDVQFSTLSLAETEAKVALDIVSAHYGEISVRTAQMCSLLGQIYSKMDRINDAETMLKRSVLYFKLCLNPSNNFVLLSLATLGTFYKIFNKPKEAILMFKEVIDNIDPCGVYLKWVHVCFEHLISTLEAVNNNKEADEVQIKLSQWLRDNPVYNPEITFDKLHQQPQAFSKFQEDFNVWEKHTKKIMDMVKEGMSNPEPEGKK